MILGAPAVTLAALQPASCPSSDHLTLNSLATIIAAVAGALVAATVAVVGYSRQQHERRRDQRAAVYAEALRAVEDYLEAPYRILRRDGSTETRRALTEHLSAIKSRISFHTGWLRLHAPADVSASYEEFVRAAENDAGPQMTAAWRSRPTKHDRDVPLGTHYDRRSADAARDAVLTAMRDDL
jgi:hypothetical protein